VGWLAVGINAGFYGMIGQFGQGGKRIKKTPNLFHM
jgi:hypothetical protein